MADFTAALTAEVTAEVTHPTDLSSAQRAHLGLPLESDE
jgi:hypothetical protein